jgi:GNAT superfamily N-acetyltransferase
MATATAYGTVEVRPVSSKAEKMAFIRMPWKVQASDPHWVAPLVMDRKDFLDRKKHPFFLHGDAELFLAWRGGEVVGRVLASDDPRYNEVHGTNRGCVGMFECVEDQAVANALFDAAAAWCKAKGRDTLHGPIDYSSNYAIGLLVDGFDTPPRVMMAHNPPYYASLWEGAGFQKIKDLYAWWLTAEQEPPERWRKLAERMAKRGKVTIRHADMKHFDQEVQHLMKIYNDAWEENWGFVKMTEAEFLHLAKDLKLLIVPELVLLAEVEGKVVGFSMALPDINEALAHLPDGKLTTFGLPVGLGKLLYYQKKIRTIRLVTLGVLPGYRRRGITEQLILRTYDVGKAMGYTGCEMSWTLEDNDLINKPIAALGSKRYKTYRVYARPID